MDNQKHPENTPGIFYVDTGCISCDTCSGIAPFSFTLTPDADHAFVHTQPKSKFETKKCTEAQNACPVEAIHQEILS